MDVARVLDLQLSGLEAWAAWMSRASGEATLYRRNGVTAAIVPTCAERSIVNSVIWRDRAGLAANLEDLASAYRDAGVHAWTVWVPDHEREAIAELEQAGHVFDGEPAAMFCDLAEVARPPGELDWDSEATPEEVGQVNDIAYGFPAGVGLGRAIGPADPGEGVRLYRGRLDGETACVLQTIDVGADTYVGFVATLPEHRSRGLASGLLATALAQARERGQRTSTLQSSPLGKGVYERLGYRVACRLQLWERREPAH